jgi:hypothetical protein
MNYWLDGRCRRWVRLAKRFCILPGLRELGTGVMAYWFAVSRAVEWFGAFGEGGFRRFLPRFMGENFTKNLALVMAL